MAPRQADERAVVASRVRALTRDSVWTAAGAVRLDFRTYHPQGMVKIGNELFISSVEVTVPTRRGVQPDGFDRDAGAGVGHLFKTDMTGRLLADVRLGEGAIYHPGGIDFDGTDIWVPVAEYRPDSRAIVYRVNPATLKPVEVLRFADHLGGIVHDTGDQALYAVSWGSRRFYRFPLAPGGTVRTPLPAPERARTLNPAHYVDYQDCKFAGAHRMLCTGVAELRGRGGSPGVRLGGLELVDLRDSRPLHQVPILLWTAGGQAMTQNPFWLEPTATGLRAYFLPEDDVSTLYMFDVDAR